MIMITLTSISLNRHYLKKQLNYNATFADRRHTWLDVLHGHRDNCVCRVEYDEGGIPDILPST